MHLSQILIRAGFFLAVFCTSGAYGQLDFTLELQTKALKAIGDAAERICNSVSTTGNSSNIELSGKAKAELAGVIKSVADLGIEGAGKYQTGEYSNVLQKDLAQAIKSNADCRQTVFNTLVDRMIPSRASPNAPPTPYSSKQSSTFSLRQAFRGADAIIVEVQIPKPRTVRDDEFLTAVGDTISFTTGDYDPLAGRGSIQSTSFGNTIGARIAVSETTLSVAGSSGYGCSGSFHLVEPGLLRGKIACRWWNTVYPTYDATINLGL
jgi:hypothetical protein